MSMNFWSFPLFVTIVICPLFYLVLIVLWWPIPKTIWTQIRLTFRSSLNRIHSVCFNDNISLQSILILKAPRKKMHLKMSSAEVVCCK